ncbi:membrane lipoprotein lipid attachment site-containing protein [Franconibacter pulveris 601]|uniref:membrane lipoprotein lipid attachment site-containing protein n=1 Tax=Franconibacter pulveris TaxID=435910 RepID=UPI0004679938|nr:membrane lipoprotein lipid attachment site-containing protein [Franconibacter pulveris]
MKKFLLVFLTALTLTGCMSTPTATQISNAYYGELPQYYEGQIKETIGSSLKDPDSAKYQFGTPSKAYFQGGIADNFKMYYGWAIPVRVNAKNSYGAYVGYQQYVFMYINDNLIDATLKFKTGYAKTI